MQLTHSNMGVKYFAFSLFTSQKAFLFKYLDETIAIYFSQRSLINLTAKSEIFVLESLDEKKL